MKSLIKILLLFGILSCSGFNSLLEDTSTKVESEELKMVEDTVVRKITNKVTLKLNRRYSMSDTTQLMLDNGYEYYINDSDITIFFFEIPDEPQHFNIRSKHNYREVFDHFTVEFNAKEMFRPKNVKVGSNWLYSVPGGKTQLIVKSMNGTEPDSFTVLSYDLSGNLSDSLIKHTDSILFNPVDKKLCAVSTDIENFEDQQPGHITSQKSDIEWDESDNSSFIHKYSFKEGYEYEWRILVYTTKQDVGITYFRKTREHELLEFNP